VLLRTARQHPGKKVRNAGGLSDPARTAQLRRVCRALGSLKVDALISIGGDGTLITANLLRQLLARMPSGHRQ
jgi:6-phosphofructokinase 1